LTSTWQTHYSRPEKIGKPGTRSVEVGKITEQNTALNANMTDNASLVSRAVESVAGIAGEKSAATQEVSASAEEMSAQIQEIVATANTTKEMAASLDQSISRFKVNAGTRSIPSEK
jgi:methyl-accepting chemotaxis protein